MTSYIETISINLYKLIQIKCVANSLISPAERYMVATSLLLLMIDALELFMYQQYLTKANIFPMRKA